MVSGILSPMRNDLAAHDAYSGPTVHPVRSGSTPTHRSVKTASPVCLSLFISHPFAVSIHLLNLCCVCLSFCKPHYRSSPCSNGCGDLREGSRRRPQQARRLYVVSRASSFLIQLRFSVRWSHLWFFGGVFRSVLSAGSPDSGGEESFLQDAPDRP